MLFQTRICWDEHAVLTKGTALKPLVRYRISRMMRQ